MDLEASELLRKRVFGSSETEITHKWKQSVQFGVIIFLFLLPPAPPFPEDKAFQGHRCPSQAEISPSCPS